MKRNKRIIKVLNKGLLFFLFTMATSCSSDSPVRERGEAPATSMTPKEPEESVAAKVYTLDNVAGNSNTNHQSINEFKDKWYFVYHNGSIPTHGSSFHRSVCVDRLYYNEDGTIKPIVMTSEGIQPEN